MYNGMTIREFVKLAKMSREEEEQEARREKLFKGKRLGTGVASVIAGPLGSAFAEDGRKLRSALGSLGGGVVGAGTGALAGHLLSRGKDPESSSAARGLGGIGGSLLGSGIGAYLAHGKYKRDEDRRD
jgi:hypothetical protein